MLDLVIQFHRTPRARAALIGAVLLALPRFAAPDSHLATGARDTAPRATAHLDFKIIIAPVLGLDLESSRTRPDALGVALFGNTRGLTLGSSAAGKDSMRHGLVLTAVAHGVILEHTYCSVEAPLGARRLLCTAAMP